MPPRIRLDGKYTPLLNKIGEHRVKRGWTVSKAADRLGEARGTYAALESGYSLPSKMLLEKLCKLYRCQAVELYEVELLARIEFYRQAMERLVSIQEEEELEDEASIDR